ncbi:uncharacterized protein DNG_00942 [Cephalotrichum gorgonifer]|uniref:DUF1365 domain-containing protein n=1 Tax=Cephalotrichum gorgonifer TaxID=2041049 RepID=A0AAE8MPZ8_9PEZI|nr:uncharacterized protein DNG_00942 [Cephalotrichum gorgonifer]
MRGLTCMVGILAAMIPQSYAHIYAPNAPDHLPHARRDPVEICNPRIPAPGVPMPPCANIEYIETMCWPNGTTPIHYDAHAQCMCKGSFFPEWIGCQTCLFVHGLRSQRERDFFRGVMAAASEKLCTGTPTAPFRSLFSEVEATAARVTAGETQSVDLYPGNSDVGLYYTPSGPQGLGSVTGDASSATMAGGLLTANPETTTTTKTVARPTPTRAPGEAAETGGSQPGSALPFSIPEAAAPTETGKPVFYKCRTTHRRMFPEKHAFGNSYLVVGIPVGWKGQSGGILSAEAPKAGWFVGRAAWFEVRAEDHLQRGGAELGLRGKLDAYLAAEGVDPAKYPSAYLITAPRALGYSFNPVSFWYLYDNTGTLEAVICEVNNTFDERRMYLVSRDETQRKLGDSSLVSEPGAISESQGDKQDVPPRIQQSFLKDFHVSPFNSRKGHYSIKANDPLEPGARDPCGFDTTITLSSSKGHPKLIARLFSLGSPLDPATLAPMEKLGLILGWGWVGLLTFPRIVKEAGALWFVRGLHVWFRPEPLSGSIGRQATTSEKFLEGVFRAYLRHLVRQSTGTLAVRYVPGGIDGPTETMRSSSAEGKGAATGELELRVLTPAFYSRFVHYAHDFEAIFTELRENETISISNPDLLPHLLLKKPSQAVGVRNLADYLYFSIIRWLRRVPPRIVRPLRSCDPPRQERTRAEDIRGFRLSSMDGYALAEASSEVRRRYRSTVTRVLLADRIALGSPKVLWVGEVIVKAVVAWLLLASAHPIPKRLFGCRGESCFS